MLKRASKDLDLVLQGNWEEILPPLLKEEKATLLFKSQFLTYKIKLEDGFTIDLVTARKEIYPEPAKLPLVQPSDFREDILRRDFTINALIYGLTPPYEEKLLDLNSFLEDLEKGIIRPLKIDSFVEDPTRALRGLRYKVRLNFRFSEEFFEALDLGKKASSFSKLSPSRLINEILLIFTKEPKENLPLILAEEKTLGLFSAFFLERREIKEEDYEILEHAKRELKKGDFEKFSLLFLFKAEEKNLERLGFSEREKREILHFEEVFSREEDFWNLKLYEKVELLERFPLYLIYVLALKENFKAFVLEYLNKLRYVRPELKGEDLKALGIAEGKKIGEILKELRRKRLEGEIKSKEEEKALVEKILKARP